MVEIENVSIDRQSKVFAAANAYLQALIAGDEDQITKTSADWETVADDISEVKNE